MLFPVYSRWTTRGQTRIKGAGGVDIFLPAAERKCGSCVLPPLTGDRPAARVDVKADRLANRLVVPGAYREARADPDEVAPALAGELRTLAAWLQLAAVRVGRRGNLAGALAAAVRVSRPG